MADKQRCIWVGNHPSMIKYHDTEWGVPVHNDKKLFEFMVLDTMQAGLSWQTIVNKRANFRSAFSNWDVAKVAGYNKRDYSRLMQDAGIIRNQQKVQAIINNARRQLEVKKEFGSFGNYLWQFVGDQPIINKHKKDSDIGATSAESEAMSKDLKKRGFQFVGPTICYAFMQGAGLVNDHVVNCFRYRELVSLSRL